MSIPHASRQQIEEMNKIAAQKYGIDSESFKKYANQNNIKSIIDKCWQHPHNRTTFQTDFYKWCNVDYSIRYTHCFIPNTQSTKNFFKQHIKHKQFTIVHLPQYQCDKQCISFINY